ncbi:MAG: agmatine deiminase family protein [Alphaproteobacteria bacterium]
MKTPAALGFAMPAEWEPHARTLVAWPCRGTLWGSAERMSRARAAYAEVARAIAAFEPVMMLVHPDDAKEAERLCGKDVEIVPLPIDDSWVRDTGPIFVARGPAGGREVAGTDWRFNGWGGKYVPHADDDKIPERLLTAWRIPRFEAPMVLEGGSITVDGEGTLYTTEECLLAQNRNPELSRADIEASLKDQLGVSHIVWLPWGIDDDETDGHIDNVAALAGPSRLLLNWTTEKDDPNYKRMRANEAALAKQRDARGRHIDVIEMPQPLKQLAWNGARLPLSYLNFYVCNGAVIAPRFDDPLDLDAKRILAAAFPEREIVQVNALDIVPGGGGIHCITQQMPAGVAAKVDG